jgi:AcrR family transcriptional regulator
MSKNEDSGVVDGRRLRSERSRLAIIEAALALQEEGILVPTAKQISDRAGVGMRSFFRHFEDMETLFEAADDQIRGSYEALFLGGDRDGTLAERIDHVVERHADAYESIKNVVLGTHAQLWRYDILRRNYARNQRGLRRDLEDWLPELKSVSGETREAVDAIASFEFWNRLRYHQGLSKKSSINILKELLKGMIQGNEPASRRGKTISESRKR